MATVEKYGILKQPLRVGLAVRQFLRTHDPSKGTDTDSWANLEQGFQAAAHPLVPKTIVQEMISVQGKPADIGGYYQPDDGKASAALRPSKTLNDILATL